MRVQVFKCASIPLLSVAVVSTAIKDGAVWHGVACFVLCSWQISPEGLSYYSAVLLTAVVFWLSNRLGSVKLCIGNVKKDENETCA